MFEELICPVCKEALASREHMLICSHGHTFDIAKKGYVNLLPAGKKRTQFPGDNPEMVLARRDFLANGHYEPIAEKTAEMLSDCPKSARILDAGCSEGYYTRYLHAVRPDFTMYGVDISKFAVEKCGKGENYAVASLFDLPIKTGSMDGIVSLFAPVCASEFSRVLRPNGILLTVIPDRLHLNGLKETLYEAVRYEEPHLPEPEGFLLEKEESLTYSISISATDAENLLQMTPYAYKTPKEGIARLRGISQLNTEVSVKFLRYKKPIQIP